MLSCGRDRDVSSRRLHNLAERTYSVQGVCVCGHMCAVARAAHRVLAPSLCCQGRPCYSFACGHVRVRLRVEGSRAGLRRRGLMAFVRAARRYAPTDVSPAFHFRGRSCVSGSCLHRPCVDKKDTALRFAGLFVLTSPVFVVCLVARVRDTTAPMSIRSVCSP